MFFQLSISQELVSRFSDSPYLVHNDLDPLQEESEKLYFSRDLFDFFNDFNESNSQ